MFVVSDDGVLAVEGLLEEPAVVAVHHLLEGVQELLEGLDVDQLLEVAGVLLEAGLSQDLGLLGLSCQQLEEGTLLLLGGNLEGGLLSRLLGGLAHLASLLSLLGQSLGLRIFLLAFFEGARGVAESLTLSLAEAGLSC